MLHIIDFINQHSNWEDLLRGTPYHIEIKRDGDYFILKYSQLESDFSNPVVRECRGSIFYQNGDNIQCVCQPFYKFGNYGESYADKIDWSTAKVMEKVDGSLIKVWYHNGWHVSTNGTIDAYKSANYAFENMTFGDVFNIALGEHTPQNFFDILDKNRVYMFELVSPYTRVTIPYADTALYFLGSRDMRTMQEVDYDDHPIEFKDFHIRHPHFFSLSSIDACIDAVNNMTRDEEGFVVVDKDFRRIKIKSPEYLLASRMRNNGAITTKIVLQLLKENKLDDFVAYCPDYLEFVEDVCQKFLKLEKNYKKAWNEISSVTFASRKEFAMAACKSPYKEYLFKKYDNNQLTAREFLFNMSFSKLVDLVKTIQND